MRLLFLIVISLLALARDTGGAEPAVPYTAQVTVPSTALRSGPSRAEYQTKRLKKGDQVEVYRREPSGWLAVRPPASSFSWVAAAGVQLSEEPDIAEVVGARVVAWVGSQIEQPREHKWQVRLDPGEPLKVLGQESLEIYPGAEAETFVKVAPPAGEFRWIHQRDIEPAQRITASPDDQEHAIRLTDFHEIGGGDDAKDQPTDFVARNSKRSPDTKANTQPEKSSGQDGKQPPLEASEFEQQIKLVDLQLTLEVVQPPELWNLAPLRKRIENLVTGAQSTLQRARARRVQQKLEEYEDLHEQYAGLKGFETSAESTRLKRESHRFDESSPDSDAAARDHAFDGKGWLMPVHASDGDSPSYALLDSAGQILQFVSPAPGFNLHRYLRKEVGVVGRQTRDRFLDKPRLIAQRAVELQRHR